MRLSPKLTKKSIESIKKHLKKLNFSNLFLNTNMTKKNHGKGKRNHQSFPKTIKVVGKNISDKDLIAKQLNTYFTEIRPKLAKTIEAYSLNFASFMESCNSTQSESALTVNKLKETFFNLR